MGKYFTIDELCATDTGLDNTPNDLETNNLKELIKVIDEVREYWTILCNLNKWGSGVITVNSGFRSEEVNKAIGGAKESEHKLGFAVDMKPSNGRNKEFWDFMVEYVKVKQLNFSQLINEKPKCNIPSWIHFSINGKKGYRKEIFTLV